jgi:hypothetical protein
VIDHNGLRTDDPDVADGTNDTDEIVHAIVDDPDTFRVDTHTSGHRTRRSEARVTDRGAQIGTVTLASG